MRSRGSNQPRIPESSQSSVILCSLHRAAVQRVVAAMNQMDQKKHEKFANQFNYALN